MPNHWTYCEYDTGADLFQGDIIARSGPLLEVLGQYHQHFCEAKYLAFLVISQTCDLVLRKQRRCKARHINLAVIRALEDIVPELFAEVSDTGIDGIYRQEDKGEARDQLERILNQNEQAHGIFYLYPDADVRIAVHAVSLLRISIALRSREHYDLLQKSRCGRLATEYRNKLGWLTGNLYSRVDTPDWSDHVDGPGEAEEIISGFVDGSKLPRPNVWVPDSWLLAGRRKNISLEDLPRDQVYDALKAHAPPPRNEVVMARVREVGAKVLTQITDEPLRAILLRLGEDDAFGILAAERASAIARANFGDKPHVGADLFEVVRVDATIRAELPAPVEEAIGRFQKHRGPREVETFLTFYAAMPIFTAPAVARVLELASGIDAARIAAFEAALRSVTPSASLVAYLRGVAYELTSGTLIERMTTRLENDQAMKAALR